MSRPRIVGIVRQDGGNAIGGVLTDGRAKLPFVRLASPNDRVVVGKEAKKILSRGKWLPAQRIHNCFKSPQTFTVSHGLTVRRLTIIEFNFDDDNTQYIVVSQAAKHGEGYVERFRSEDSLIGDWFCRWAKEPDIRGLMEYKLFSYLRDPSYELLTETAELSRRTHSEDPYWSKFDLSDVMSRAMTGW